MPKRKVRSNTMQKTKIDWCDMSWNPVTGCLHGCKYCYARRIAERFGNLSPRSDNDKIHTVPGPMYRESKSGEFIQDVWPFGFEPTFHRYRLNEPQQVKKPSIIGVVYMGDLFGEWVPDEWINEVMIAISEAPQHTYMFLTKNPDRYYDYFNGAFQDIPEEYDFNGIKIWFGTTITKQSDLNKIWPKTLHMLDFFSIEPMLGEINLEGFLYDEQYWDYHVSEWALNWCILGQQTGPGAVPPKPEWVQSIIDQCRAAGVPVFVKSPLYERFPIQEWPEGLKEVEHDG